MCCDAPSPPPPPDYSKLAASSEAAARIAADSAAQDLAFRKQVYEESLPRQAELYNLASQVARQQLGIADANEGRAREQWDYWRNAFQPVERDMVLDAYQGQYLTEDEIAQLRANPALGYQFGKIAADRKAAEDIGGLQELEDRELAWLENQRNFARAGVSADVNNAYGQQARMLTRMGGDPNRIAAMAGQIANQQALARVSGLNQIERNYADLAQAARQGYGLQKYAVKSNRYAPGTSLRAGAASFGRNMPNTAGQAYGLATQAGNSAVANQNTGFQSGLPYAQFQAGGYGSQLGAAGIGVNSALGVGGLMNQGYATQIAGYNAQQQANAAGLAGLGQAAGTGAALYFLCDRRLKTDVVRIGTHPIGVGLYEYTLFGARQQGVMADEVEEVLPEAVVTGVDGYKRVNYAMLG